MSATPSILVRPVNSGNDPLWGQGKANFITDAAAVAQLVGTRLKLFVGEWWANKLEGLPLWQSIVGRPANNAQMALIIQARILSTPFVTGVTGLAVSFNAATRQFTFSATVQTQFGPVAMQSFPLAPNQGLPE